MKKSIFLIVYLTYSLIVNAQWRIGVTGGATYNQYSITNHYKADRHCNSDWGNTIGFMGQYDFSDWFGVRADLNWTMKNHWQYRMSSNYIEDNETLDYRTSKGKSEKYKTSNGYLQLPVMVSFCFGSKKIKGILNTGIYGGYWLCSNDEIVKERDQRFDCGFVGGGGLEWRFKRNWALQAETRIYYGIQSCQKDYMKIKDPRYNTTFALQGGFCYLF